MGTAEARAQDVDTAPVDWGVVIQSLINVAIAEERRFNREVMAAVLAE